jgi:hypothetical protein
MAKNIQKDYSHVVNLISNNIDTRLRFLGTSWFDYFWP